MAIGIAARWLAVLAVAFGAFAFGGVYPWAYWPLAVGCQVAGLLGLAAERRALAGASRALTVALLLLAVAALVQVAPLPRTALDAISPATSPVVGQVDLAFGAGMTNRHPLSINPSFTWTALALYGSFALLLVGTSRMASLHGARTTIAAVTIVGVCLALAGIIQKATFNGQIYGFWTTETGGSPFGPFVNKNHFAGWMLMAIPLSLGLLCAGIARGMHGVRPEWRERILWFSSPDASRIVLIAGAAATMAVSLVLTMSRSGMCALVVALVTTGWFVFYGRTSRVSKAAAGGLLVGIVLLAGLWVGADAIGARFAAADWEDYNDRRGAWQDAWRIASMFPITGTGLNTYATATHFFQQHDRSQHYEQAHSDYLQLAAEGGLLLAIPAIVCLFFFVRDVRRRFREDGESSSYWLRAGAVAALVAIALQETVEFSLQMPGNAALFAVVCGIALHKSQSRRRG